MTILDDERLFWFLNRGTGVVLLVLMTASVALGVLATVRTTSRWWPRFVTQALHRNVALLSVALLIAHAGVAIYDSFVDLTMIDSVVPFMAGYRPLWSALGTISLDLTVLAVLTSLARHRFGLRRWRALHLTTYLAWLLGLGHGLGIGTDQRTVWSISLTATCIGVVALAGVVRLIGLTHERALEPVGSVLNDERLEEVA
jgi:methionine sulfoxide reductase heme-binding subunit